LTAPGSAVVVVFAPEEDRQGPLDYGRRLGRLRWRRAMRARRAVAPEPSAPARLVLEGARYGILVRDERALPAALSGTSAAWTEPILPALPLPPAAVPVHTLREVEACPARISDARSPDRSRVPAVAVDLAAVAPREGETVGAFTGRIWEESREVGFDHRFRALVLEDPPDFDRSELLERLPAQTRNLCDAGCAGGAAGRAFRLRAPDVRITGIEKDPRAAALARHRLDRVLEEDVLTALERLDREGEKFDGFLFADVLEHLTDPVAALTRACRLASAGAVLVASVPNVGHLSLVRDLVVGRFDPVPAGLADAGHLRWFDRRFLTECLEEAGWRVKRVEGLSGAPPPDPQPFLSHFGQWEGLDRESLRTYQWVAVAGVSEESR
jgi:2-polyprenyl-3-methyl-5-hydroxy-6-metoxy-1,4-benzoquinol methylase